MVIKKLRSALCLVMMGLATLLAGCGGGSGDSSSGATTGSGTGTGSSTTTTSTSTTPTIALSVATVSGATTSMLNAGVPLVASAVVKNASGKGVQGVVVTFTGDSSYITFTPSKGTALTDENGIASLRLNAASLSSVGATTIQATTQYGDGTTPVSLTSSPYGLAVGSANVTLGSVTVGTPTVSAYGSTSVSVPVYINGVPATVPVNVDFTSACVQSHRATITTPVTSVSGVATTTYTDLGCASAPNGEAITASVSGTSAVATATVIALAPVASNLQFVSAAPNVIATRGTGSSTLPQSSVVKFKVVDANNNPVSGKQVSFTLMPAATTNGVALSSTTGVSDSNGEVAVSVASGSVPTPVWVHATIVNSSPAIVSQSTELTVTTGLPTQNFFSLSMGALNIEGRGYDGKTTSAAIIASDRLGNPVPDGTVINFISEGGQIGGGTLGRGSCQTAGGGCSVTLRSADYRPVDETVAGASGIVGAVPVTDVVFVDGPLAGQTLYVQNGRVTLLAYALGEKSFVDTNGNNRWDAGETFYDLGDLYLDANENAQWDSAPTQPNLGEQFIAYPQTANSKPCMTQMTATSPYTAVALPSYYSDAPSKQNTCSGMIDNGEGMKAYVRRESVVVFSGSFGQITQRTYDMNGACGWTFGFWLMDANYNPMPASSKLSVTANSVAYTSMQNGQIADGIAEVTIANAEVGSTTHPGGTWHAFSVAGKACVAKPHGSFVLNVTTPQGNVTAIPITIQ